MGEQDVKRCNEFIEEACFGCLSVVMVDTMTKVSTEERVYWS